MFIYDMAGSQYTNFELDLSKKILNLLKVMVRVDLVSGGGFAHQVREVLWVWCGFPPWTMLTMSRPRSTDPIGAQEGVESRTQPYCSIPWLGGLSCPGWNSSHSCWQRCWENRCKLFSNCAGIWCLLPSLEGRNNSKYGPGCVLQANPGSPAEPIPYPA